MAKKSKIIVLVGPSGSGKTTIAEEIIEQSQNDSEEDCIKVITCTTRNIRNGEVNGVHYHYLTEKQFKELIKNNEFVEYCSYAGNLYGTRYKELDEVISKNQNAILVMDINGAKAIKSRYPDNSISIFLDRDKIDLVMAILERSVSNEEKAKRIIQLDEDEKARHQCDFVVKNDNLEKAIKEVKSYIA